LAEQFYWAIRIVSKFKSCWEGEMRKGGRRNGGLEALLWRILGGLNGSRAWKSRT
jgi:hypothetical protein